MFGNQWKTLVEKMRRANGQSRRIRVPIRRRLEAELLEARDVPAIFTWTQTVPGEFDWNNTANWSGGAVPSNNAGDIVNIASALQGNETITLDGTITVGALNLGSGSAGAFFTIVANGGSLTFDTLSGSAVLNDQGQGGDSINAPMILDSNLTLSSTGTLPLALGGDITASSPQTITSSGAFALTGTATVDTNVTLAGTGTFAATPVIYTTSYYDGALYEVNENTGALLAVLVAPNQAPPWQPSTAYENNPGANNDDIVSNAGNEYIVVTSGTSASGGGPTGTGSAITDGTVVWKYVGPAPSSSPLLQYASGVTVGPDGNLYISNESPDPTNPSDSLLEYNLTTQTLSTFVDNAELQAIATLQGAAIFNPSGIVFGPDGNLYVSLNAGFADGTVAPFQFHGAVIRFDVTDTAGTLSYSGTHKAVATKLAQPAGLVFGITSGDTGNLYVNTAATADVTKITGATGSTPSSAEFISAGSGGLVFPSGIAWGPDGKLYVAELFDDTFESGAVFRYNANGTFDKIFVSTTGDSSGHGSLFQQFPYGEVFNSQGDLILANFGNNGPTTNEPHTFIGALYEYNSSGTFVKALVSSTQFAQTGPSSIFSGIIPSQLTAQEAPVLTVNGTLNPGGLSSAGTLTAGDVSFESGSNLNLAINGTTAGTGFSRLVSTGTVDITGATLNLSLGFTPTINSTYTIISGQAIAGTFTNGASVLAGGFNFSITYNASTVVLKAVSQVGTITVAAGSNQSTVVGAGFPVELEAHVVDSSNNPISGAIVTFSGPATGAGITFPGGVDTATTDGSGDAKIAVVANTKSGSYMVNATVTILGSLISTSPSGFTLTNLPGSATDISAVSGNSQSTPVGTGFTDPLTVLVTDIHGNPVSGILVTFAGPGSGASAIFPSSTTATTGTNGEASVRVDANTIAGSYNVTASASGLTPTSFSLANDAGPATNINVVSGNGQMATVEAPFTNTLEVNVADIYGNPLSGATVTFAGPGSGAGVTFPAGATATTDSSGNASISVDANTHAGTYTVTATTNGISPPASFTLTNTAGAISAVHVVSGSGQSATVEAAFTDDLVASVTDADGNPISGVLVTFTGPATGAGIATTPLMATTGADGESSVSVYANTVAGSYTVAASATGATSTSFSLTNTAGAPASISVTSGSGQTAAVEAPFTNSLVVTVLDSDGNPVPGVLVTFAGPGSGADVTFPSGATATTGANGQAGVAVDANTHSGSYTVTASATGVSPSASFSLTNAAGSPASISLVSGGGQSATVEDAFTDPLVASVLDADGNPVPGVVVTFTSPVSGAGIAGSPVTATTGANGQASAPIDANTHAGLYTVSATTPGAATPVTYSLTNIAGTAAIITVVSGSGQSGVVGTTFAAGLEAKVTDADGNPVSGVLVTFAGPGTGAGVTFPSGTTATTGVNGEANIVIEPNDTVGHYNVSASAAGVANPAEFALSNIIATLTNKLIIGGIQNGTAELYDVGANGKFNKTATATLAPFTGDGVNVRSATGDVNGDGIPDNILVTGPGTPIRVTVIDGVDNRTVLVPAFDPFGGNFQGGGFVAAADFDGNGRAEIVVTPDQGGGPRVVIFSLATDGVLQLKASFLGIDDPNFRGGARVAVGDINDDGIPDILIAAGIQGGPRVALFNGQTAFTTQTKLVNDFYAFPEDAQTLRNGVFVALGDINGDGFDDLIFGGGPGGGPRVDIISGKLLMNQGSDAAIAAPLANFFVANDSTDRGGVRLSTADINGDGVADVIAASGSGDSSRVRVYFGTTFGNPGEPTGFQDIDPFNAAKLSDGVYVG